MNRGIGSIKKQTFEDTESVSSEVVETWEDLLCEDEQPTLNSVEVKDKVISPEDPRYKSEMESAVELFGDSLTNPVKITLREVNETMMDIPEDLIEHINTVSKAINEAKSSSNTPLIKKILRKLFLVPETSVDESIIDRMSDLVLSVISEIKENPALTKISETEEKVIESSIEKPKPVVANNAPIKPKGPSKKSYLNVGASKKKFKKQWIEDEMDMGNEYLDDGSSL